MPQARKPNEVHKRTGTFRADRHGETSGALALAPTYDKGLYELPPHEALERVLAEGSIWLAYTDSVMLALLRETLGLRVDLLERAKLGDLAALRGLSLLDERVHKMLSDLGFTPTARSRLGVAEVKARSKLEELRERASKVADKGSAGGQTKG